MLCAKWGQKLTICNWCWQRTSWKISNCALNPHVNNCRGILYGRCWLYLTQRCSSSLEWFNMFPAPSEQAGMCVVGASITLVHSTENSSWAWGTVKTRLQVKLLLKNMIYWSLCLVVFSIFWWFFEKTLLNNEKLTHIGIILTIFLIQTLSKTCEVQKGARKLLLVWIHYLQKHCASHLEGLIFWFLKSVSIFSDSSCYCEHLELDVKLWHM